MNKRSGVSLEAQGKDRVGESSCQPLLNTCPVPGSVLGVVTPQRGRHRRLTVRMRTHVSASHGKALF